MKEIERSYDERDITIWSTNLDNNESRNNWNLIRNFSTVKCLFKEIKVWNYIKMIIPNDVNIDWHSIVLGVKNYLFLHR